jgi:hypothetical protein
MPCGTCGGSGIIRVKATCPGCGGSGHLSGREAATLLGCSRNAFNRWLNGAKNKSGEPLQIPKYIALACTALAKGLRPWKPNLRVEEAQPPTHPQP